MKTDGAQRNLPVLLMLCCVPAGCYGQQRCLACHPSEVKAFARSGMGTSITVPTGQFDASVEHFYSKSKISISTRDGVTRHRIERGGLAAEYAIAFAIGSGKVGRSYAVRVGDALFQSPVSWYAQRARWDMSPGYYRERYPDFDRRITLECLFCHAGRMERVSDLAAAMTCERCHGSAAGHVTRPSARNIVNPAKLPARSRDSVCEQCHLGGETRILNPGRVWTDFEPGKELESVFTTYVKSSEGGALKVVSHSEQLALSACAVRSGGKIWCGTCHSPHGERKNQREVCLSCHEKTMKASHPRTEQDCASCHMPRRSTPEVAHTVYTDHRIRKTPAGERATVTETENLIAWREPDAAVQKRNLGLAYLGVGQRDRSAPALQEGFRILAGLEGPLAKDPEVLAGLGLVLLQKQRPKEAAQLFQEAARAEPKNARHAHNLGVALEAAGDNAGAIAQLERAIQLDPLLEEAYAFLVELCRKRGNEKLRQETIRQYLRWMPQSLAFRSLQ